MEVVFSSVLTKQKYNFKLVNFFPIYFEVPDKISTLHPILCFGFDLELFQEIKFKISGKLKCDEVYSVRELKILGINNYQLPHLKTLNREFWKSHLPPTSTRPHD